MWNRHLPLIAAAVVLAAGISVSAQLGRLDIERRASEERSVVVSELAATRAQLEGVIKATFNSTDGLVHLIALQDGISKKMFADMAYLAIEKNAHIRNISIAPDDEVRFVYPHAGNEKVLGFRYATVPEQNRTVQLARERQAPILAGPIDLVQGGRALIHRYPIFTRHVPLATESSRYWGAASIVANANDLLKAGGFYAVKKEFRIALRGKDGKGKDGEVIEGEPALFSRNPVLATVLIPGGEWQLAAVPEKGWMSKELHSSSYFLVGLLNTLLLAGIAWLLTSRASQVRQSNADLAKEIAVREQTEAALREEEQRFHTLFESLPDPVWIIAGNRFIDCNTMAASLLGYPDKGDFLFVHPAQLSPQMQPDGELSFSKANRMIQLARDNGLHRFEWVHTRANGEEFPAEVTLRLITLQGKEAIYCVWRDITERKQAEKELRASQELLKAIVDSAGAVIYVFDIEGRLLLCNNQFEHVVGHQRQQILGQRRNQFLPAAVAAEHEANDRKVIEEERMTSFEEHNLEPDGPHYYLTVKCPVIGSDTLRAVVGISTDITARKQDEEKLRFASTVLATTIEGVMVTNVDGNIVSVNAAFTEITGYAAEEVIGSNPRILRSDRQQSEFYQSMWAAIAQGGVWQGEIWNRRKTGDVYPEWLTITAICDDSGRLTHYVGVFSDISSLKRSQAQLERLAHFDPLTDLPNRTLFQDRLAHAIDRARRCENLIAVLLIDLDGFKTVNDSLGHPVGDRLLQEIALRLKTCIRIEDTVARLGGDEFAVVLANMVDGGDSIEVVRKILAAINTPIDLDGLTAQVSASIGIAIFPTDGDNAIELVRNADAAMYGAKEAGRRGYCFYRANMTHRAQELLLQEQALRRAIEQKEFEVWFQPQLSLQTGMLTGAEALVRWRDPERGLIPPLEFIPLAEHTGLIIQIGEQVLQQVCQHARRWLDAGLSFGRLAVNVSTPQIDRSDFVATLKDALHASGLPSEHLEIEVTESLIMKNAEHANEVLLAIQALGVTTAVDDFGTGYSSLAYLKKLPIDKLKIDRAFIDGLPDDTSDSAIARAIIAMAHSLGFKVIAEGIETAEQQAFLRNEGCDEAQGFYFSRPLPPAEFELWLTRATAPELPRLGEHCRL
jgi:diguanylate cyclase (GGDEF)-like protein/PAS domain S-box-containing protein